MVDEHAWLAISMRTFVIGGENCVLGLALMGVEGRVVHNAQEFGEALDQCLADTSIGLVLIPSSIAFLHRERVDGLKISSMKPLVVEIPGHGDEGGYPSLRELVQRAIGIRLGGEQ